MSAKKEKFIKFLILSGLQELRGTKSTLKENIEFEHFPWKERAEELQLLWLH